MEYGQFCPIAKATEILGDKWTLLIVRELLMGSTRFNELQRGLSQISPTILTKRLNTLADEGIVIRKRVPGMRGHEYFLSQSGKELFPVLHALGSWGMRWLWEKIKDSDYDVELLMLYLQRSVQTDKLIGDETVIHFHFTDLNEYKKWWLVAREQQVDLCVQDPGKEVDIYFSVELGTMIRIWMGEYSYKKAKTNNLIKVTGPNAMIRDINEWLAPSIFSGMAPASEIKGE